MKLGQWVAVGLTVSVVGLASCGGSAASTSGSAGVEGVSAVEAGAADPDAANPAVANPAGGSQEEATVADETAPGNALAPPPPEVLPLVVGDGQGDAQCLALPGNALGFGTIGESDWDDWVDDVEFAVGVNFIELLGETQGERTLRQRYEPSGRGSPRVIVRAELPGFRTYRLVQSLFFQPGFDWGGEELQTGKLGFGFGGGTSPTGGEIDTSGFSARLIWHGNLDGTARLAVYSYAADRPGMYGDEIFVGEFVVPVGEWFDVAIEVTANSDTASADGRLRAWVNNALLLDQSGIAWQTAGNRPVVDKLYYSSFYGGNSSSWSPDYVTYMQVRDVCWAPVVDGYSGIDPDQGRTRAPSAQELDQLQPDDDTY